VARAGSAQVAIARAAGLRVAAEAFADRGFAVARYDQRDAGESTRMPDTGGSNPFAALARKRGTYSSEDMTDDAVAVLDALGIPKAHVVGLSMGGFATLHFGLTYPERSLSLVVAGCGYGAEPGKRQQFHDETAKTAALIESAGMKVASEAYAIGPSRVQFQNKDPRGFDENIRQLTDHSVQRAITTLLGVQASQTGNRSLPTGSGIVMVPTRSGAEPASQWYVIH